ncbi:sensor histidine kinase [Catenuloplanes sp. NPDC051500]|uniref:sensor histidine kinase n=1 Tax=Catenuloplanes sp. NPDC051500 TaxID=3363959 RepID=UPI0037A09A2D
MVPIHRSIVLRLLGTSIAVVVLAVTATAWLAVQTTTAAVRQAQGRSLADDQGIVDVLLGYAAVHDSWDGVGELLATLATKTGQRISLLTEERTLITESGPGPSLAQGPPTATVDPLRVGDAALIDARVVGPYLLPERERRELRAQAEAVVACLTASRVRAEIEELPSGRVDVRPAEPDERNAGLPCGLYELRLPTDTEETALGQLATRTLECLGTPDVKMIIGTDFDAASGFLDGQPFTVEEFHACLATAREQQLRPYTAPPALLFVTDPAAGAQPRPFTLSRDNIIRIVLVTGAVLAVTVAFTVVAGLRLVRPLRALTVAAGAPLGAHRPMPVAGRDEIGHLASVLNDLSVRRDRAEQQRKAMISDIAHELRNPMTNIQSWLEAAEDGVTPADARLLALLLDETAQLARILDDLRDLAAADAGTLRLHPEPIRLGDVLGPAAESHRGAADTGGVRLRASYDPELPIVADPVRLRQVVGNLISNAVRHTPAGGTVAIGAGVAADELLITVADTGSGIAPEDLPHVFDRFWRADHSRRRVTGGSGLGLAIVRDLAAAHGGGVEVVSTLGAGTTVTVRVPLTRTA